MTAVKICGLTTPEDAVAAAQAGAHAVGLVFDRGPCRVDHSTASQLLRALDGLDLERVAIVGAVSLEGLDWYKDVGFDLIQWVPPQAVGRTPSSPLPLLPAFFDSHDLVDRVARWRRLHPATETSPRSFRGTINIDGAGGGGTGRRADWGRARTVARTQAVTLSGGLRPENLAEAIELVKPHGVDVSSGVESSPGRKDHQAMRDFVDIASGASS